MSELRHFLRRTWYDEQGVLAFEWVLVATLLVIGIVGGIAATRDAIIDELGDIAEASISLDQSYFLPGIRGLGIKPMKFDDKKPHFSVSDRNESFHGQPDFHDVPS